MEIHFESEKFKTLANNHKNLQKRYGTQVAKSVTKRMGNLRAANNLEDMCSIFPGKCEELTGNRQNTFSLRLDRQWRLIFYPTEPVPRKDDGGIDRRQVTSIVVVGVEDYHRG